MYQTQLEVVNACLATMGEQPLNSLDDEHVFKQSALNYLDGSNRARQKTGLWFNVEDITLPPQQDSKFVYIPQDTIHTAKSVYGPMFAQRGKRLYDPINNKYEWDAPVRLVLVRLIPFEDCPFYAQDAIALEAILRFQREFDGDTTRYNQLNADRQRAELELNAEHIRSIAPNLLDALSNRAKMLNITRYNNGNQPGLGWPGR